jgi:hypothetical protein
MLAYTCFISRVLSARTESTNWSYAERESPEPPASQKKKIDVSNWSYVERGSPEPPAFLKKKLMCQTDRTQREKALSPLRLKKKN